MKTLKWSLLVVLVTGVAVLTMMRQTRSPRPLAMDANEITDDNQRNRPAVYQFSPLVTAPLRKLFSTVSLRPDKTDVPAADIASQPANVMRVRADQVLARVNDQAILLKHLVPLQPDEQEQAMISEEFDSRLNRAIEMELTFQAAAARGMDLTPDQKKRVAGIAQRHEATLQQYRKEGVTWSSVTLAQVEFEKRLTSALMLQQNLVAAEAHTSIDPLFNVEAEHALFHPAHGEQVMERGEEPIPHAVIAVPGKARIMADLDLGHGEAFDLE